MIKFSVNGAPQSVDPARGSETLLDYLHDDLNLTGTKLCCGIGVCRACTVIVEKGPAANPSISCSTPLSVLGGTNIRTVEGVAEGDRLSAVQDAFLRHFSFQCGYCAPGFVMAGTALVEQARASNLSPDQMDAAIEDALGQHICRCTGYVRYYDAMRELLSEVLADKEGAQ